MFGNSDGQPYATSGWNTNLRRLMAHDEKKALEEGVQFARFTLKDMMPAAVTDRVEAGNDDVTNATENTGDRMVREVYDRRKIKSAKATQ